MNLKDLSMGNDIQQERDVLGGNFTFDTDIYDFTIKLAYLSKSSGGATAVNLVLETDDNRKYNETVYITSKDGKNYYVDKQNNKQYLPGFNLINNLAALTVGKYLPDLNPEEKVIPIYDYDQKKELPTKAPVLMELVGKRVTAGVVKEIVDKNIDTGNVDANGKKIYAASGETREVNVLDKFYEIGTGFTVPEKLAKATESAFKQQWADKYKGTVRNKAKGKAEGGTPGASAQNGSSTPAKGKSLFD